eukprot:888425-Pelagomonas_calceolata.AAC.5
MKNACVLCTPKLQGFSDQPQYTHSKEKRGFLRAATHAAGTTYGELEVALGLAHAGVVEA